jgi:small subunit ribosomal protein S17
MIPVERGGGSLKDGPAKSHTPHRREMVGEVISDKMEKTVVVIVKRLTRHAKYGKVIRRITKVKAHNENNACHVGDYVRLVETRPLSKDKNLRVVEIVNKASVL